VAQRNQARTIFLQTESWGIHFQSKPNFPNACQMPKDVVAAFCGFQPDGNLTYNRSGGNEYEAGKSLQILMDYLAMARSDQLIQMPYLQSVKNTALLPSMLDQDGLDIFVEQVLSSGDYGQALKTQL